MEWRLENEHLGLAPDLTDTWTPEQREAFLHQWNDNEVILQTSRGEKRYDEMLDGDDDEPVQIGRGQCDERPFNIESVTQVNIEKFKTIGMNYRVRFTNTLASAELTNLHERLHHIFQQILDKTIGGVPPQDQVRVVNHSNQLEYPITFPFDT